MCFWKRYNPDIIDLLQYEKDLLYQREHGIVCRPPKLIPGRDWTTAELQAMRENREKAKELYLKYRGDK